MSQAEIKTKLTADGSELSRALNRGMEQAAGFQKRAQDLGKAIGRAFTITVAIRGAKEAMAQMDSLIEKERELRRIQLESNKKAGDISKGVEKAETSKDLEEERKRIEAEIQAIQARMNELDFPTFGEKMKDMMEAAFTGEATASDQEKAALQKRLNEMIKLIEQAKQKAPKIKEEEVAKEATDAAKESTDWAVAEAEAEQQLNKWKREGIALEEEKLRIKREQADAAFEEQFGRQSAARNLLMGFMPDQSQRFSNLRRIGANELGSGVANRDNPAAIADKIIDKVGSKIAEGTAAFKDYGQKVLQGIGSFI